jgi:DNA gyrase subunit A
MSSKKRKIEKRNSGDKMRGIINGSGEIIEQNIATTLEKNYMPYAMSVILSRAIPEIDGFKPSHRKLLYTMYKMNLLGHTRTKSANIVGQTMKLNPHGDTAIYETMVRLSRGYEALLHPYIDSKGNFGKFYSRDMAYAASRYTEAKLDDICFELFRDIDKNTVNFVDNYDNTLKEPSLLPASFPSILVNANTGIAVGMASSICPFNLKEVCDTTISLIQNLDHDVMKTLLAPDFPGGGQIVYMKKSLEEIYRTGRGGLKVRAKYKYDESENCIDILNIPPTTTCEAIIEKIIDLVKQGKVKEITDVLDETGLNGLKLTIDLKRGVDPDKLMQKLYALTPLEDTFSCNFNILIGNVPQVLGIKELLKEWIKFRVECVRRRTNFDLNKMKEKLHLLEGLSRILLDIDKAIRIIRETLEESGVIPNLMAGFKIDEVQAEYIAEIKLRYLNRAHILKRIKEKEQLIKDVEKLEDTLKDSAKLNSILICELEEVVVKYGQERKSSIICVKETSELEENTDIPDYPVTFFFTKEGYFKKITPQSLRTSGEQKLKETDKITQIIAGCNSFDLLFFTNRSQVYKAKANDFPDSKTSLLGEYVGAKLNMDKDEKPLYLVATKNYNGFLLFFFENGKVAKVSLESYATKTNRKRLVNAYSSASSTVKIEYKEQDEDYLLTSTAGRALIFSSSFLQTKTTRDTKGITVFKLKNGQKVSKVELYNNTNSAKLNKYKFTNLPSEGVALSKKFPNFEQLKF